MKRQDVSGKLRKHVQWFELTRARTGLGDCGQCGNPGTYCTCVDREPCGCGLAGLHEIGSALLPGALGQFADMPVAEVDQDGLF